MKTGRGLIRGTSGPPVREPLAVVVVRSGLAREPRPIVEGIRVYDRARPGGSVAERADIDAAAAADQKLRSTGAEPIRLDQRPILGPDLDRAVRIAGRAGRMRAAERTLAGAHAHGFRRRRQMQPQSQIAAMAAAAMLHYLSPIRYSRDLPAAAALCGAFEWQADRHTPCRRELAQRYVLYGAAAVRNNAKSVTRTRHVWR